MILFETQVFQKRFDGSIDFNRNWANYTEGFGVLAGGEFWWGLESLQNITAQGTWILRVELVDWDGNTAHATYDSFKIQEPLYTLSVGAFVGGNAGKHYTGTTGKEQ